MHINFHRVFVKPSLSAHYPACLNPLNISLEKSSPINAKHAPSSLLQDASVMASTDLYAGESHAAQRLCYALDQDTEKSELEFVQLKRLVLSVGQA